MFWWKRFFGGSEPKTIVSKAKRARYTYSNEVDPFRRYIEDKIRPYLAKEESKRLAAILENPEVLEKQLPWEVEPESFTIYEAQYHGEPRGFVSVPDGKLADYTARIKNLLDIDLVATEASKLAKSDPETVVQNGLFIFQIHSIDLMLEYPDWAESYLVAYFGQQGFKLLSERVDWLRATLPIFPGADYVLLWDDKLVLS